MMKNQLTEESLLPLARVALEKCLASIPMASVIIDQGILFQSLMRPDFVFNVNVAGRNTTIIAEFKKSGEPRFAHSAINEIQMYYRKISPADAGGIFIAPFISEATAKLCRDEEIGYLDLAGNCHIALPGVYIHIEGKGNPFAHSRSLLSLYQPKAERVLRVLLTYPHKHWRIQALANEAKVSTGQSFKVKNLLLEKEWLEESNQGILLTKPKDLLATWAEHYKFNKHQIAQYYTTLELTNFEQTLSVGCQQRAIPCAFTSFVAAARYAPYATYGRTTAYIHHELKEVQELLNLSPLQLVTVETGANVILLSPYDDGIFYKTQQRQDISLTSPLQTYLDLQHTGGRGKEAAEILLQKEINPNW